MENEQADAGRGHVRTRLARLISQARTATSGKKPFSCFADHEQQDWQPYPVDPYSAVSDDHPSFPPSVRPSIHPYTYINTYINTYIYPSIVGVGKRGIHTYIQHPKRRHHHHCPVNSYLSRTISCVPSKQDGGGNAGADGGDPASLPLGGWGAGGAHGRGGFAYGKEESRRHQASPAAAGEESGG